MPSITDRGMPAPYWSGGNTRLWHGHAPDILARAPERSVQCVVTSPPYWGLRDYGTGTWEGGEAGCDHKAPPKYSKTPTSSLGRIDGYRDNLPADNAAYFCGERQYRTICGKCGARRVDRQIGAEPSPDCDTKGQAQCGQCFVCSMVSVFRAVRRVLRDDGVLWLNLGDSYSCSPKGGRGDESKSRVGRKHQDRREPGMFGKHNLLGIKAKDLIGVPWRVALALQADGWWLRSDIIWHKPSPMPESVRDRCTRAHEYVFQFTKRGTGYFYDAEAVREPLSPTAAVGGRYAAVGKQKAVGNGYAGLTALGRVINPNPNGRNKRSVWSADEERALFDWLAANEPDTLARFLDDAAGLGSVWRISFKGYKGAHFACFPPALVEPCVLAGTSGRGACARCGAPWRRRTKDTKLVRYRPNDHVKRDGAAGTGNACPNTVAGVKTETLGWLPTCYCGARVGTRPCLVLDPFVGSGTTAAVCERLGLACWGIDLNDQYLADHAVPRAIDAIAVAGNTLRRNGEVV